MDRRITSRVNMFNAVLRLCNDRPAVVASIPAFARRVTQLGDFLAVLQALMRRLLQNMEGLAKAKEAVREELSLLLSVGCGAGVSYAKDEGDLVLEKKFDYPESDFMRMRDAELVDTSANILELLTTHAAGLRNYGIDEAFMTRLTRARSDFNTRNPEPVLKVYTNEADLTELMKKTFEVSAFVLQDMMSAAKIFKLNDRNFYDALENASRISKVGVRHKPAPEEMEQEAAQKQTAAEKKQEKAERRTKLEEQRRRDAEELEKMLQEITDNTEAMQQQPVVEMNGASNGQLQAETEG